MEKSVKIKLFIGLLALLFGVGIYLYDRLSHPYSIKYLLEPAKVIYMNVTP